MESGGDHHHVVTIQEGSHEITELPNGSPPPNQRGEESIGESFVDWRQMLLDENMSEIKPASEMKNAGIFRVPQSLRGISSSFDIEPEIVSIGPYHRGKDQVLEFENYKRQFLHSLLDRAKKKGVHLQDLIRAVQGLESRARDCYSENIQMSSDDFVGMMVLDSGFIIEIFQQLFTEENIDNSLIFLKPWSIPILCRDLLKLENQLPFFVLQDLFDLTVGNTGDRLWLLALKFFNLVFRRSTDLLKKLQILTPLHLLHLFHSSYSRRALPQGTIVDPILRESKLSRYINYLPRILWKSQISRHTQPLSNESMPCVTRLRRAGMKFRPRNSSVSFLDIGFHEGGVLLIPPITINDFIVTVLINCAAFEQAAPESYQSNRCGRAEYRLHFSQYFSEYIAFMSCLISSARDVTFLCEDGIIANFSHADPRVAVFFEKLGKNVVFNIRECYLSDQFRQVEAYYGSNWATLRRTYFSNRWAVISVISASLLLVFAAIQTLMTILSYCKGR